MNIFTFQDLLEHFPFRHVDKTKVNLISDITPQTEYIQVAGKLLNVEVVGDKRAKRLVAQLKDKTGFLELVWFQGINWVQKILEPGQSYLVYGKSRFLSGQSPDRSSGNRSYGHPIKQEGKSFLEPVYPTTEKLKARGLGGRQIGKLTQVLLSQLQEKDIPENLPDEYIKTVETDEPFQSLQADSFSRNSWHIMKKR